MINSFFDIQFLSRKYNLPEIEIVALLVNLFGVRTDLPYKRVRFIIAWSNLDLMFSVENTKMSPFIIHNGFLWVKNHQTSFTVYDLVEDCCEVIYTRKKETIISFNPNNRSSCFGCLFCYKPNSNDQKRINTESIKSFFEEWMQVNGLSSLSHIEQVALVTGCFKMENESVEYIIKMREALASLGFNNEIFYLGMIKDLNSIRILSEARPFHLCFTVECFERRELMLKGVKCIGLKDLLYQMDLCTNSGIETSFSYIVGLDTLSSIKKNFIILKDHVTQFPLVSIYQTDIKRESFRTLEAKSLNYYFQSRNIIQTTFKDMNLYPNSWNNYRSLWRTCYGDDNMSILTI